MGRSVLRGVRRDVAPRRRGTGEAGVPREAPDGAVATQPHVQRVPKAQAQPPGQGIAQDGDGQRERRGRQNQKSFSSRVRDGGGQLPVRARRRRRLGARGAQPTTRQVTALPRIRILRGGGHIHRRGRGLGGETIRGARCIRISRARTSRRRVQALSIETHRRDRRTAGDAAERGEGRHWAGRRRRRGGGHAPAAATSNSASDVRIPRRRRPGNRRLRRQTLRQRVGGRVPHRGDGLEAPDTRARQERLDAVRLGVRGVPGGPNRTQTNQRSEAASGARAANREAGLAAGRPATRERARRRVGHAARVVEPFAANGWRREGRVARRGDHALIRWARYSVGDAVVGATSARVRRQDPRDAPREFNPGPARRHRARVARRGVCRCDGGITCGG